ncbi:EpsG family protein [Vibrio sp. 10N.261.51.A4]|uniref:EpsG family protein n=1 Tax=Vibrio sp. 10N.261.51.A4 TaxID=3229674 RepID=UPI003550BE01
MFFYSCFVFLVSGLFFTSYLTKSNIFSLFALFLIVMLSATRLEIGYDYFNYVGFYSVHLPESLEPLFKLSINLMNSFDLHYREFFFIYSIVTIFVLYIAIAKYTPYRKSALLIFILIPGLYLNSFSIIRQSIAASFVFFAIYYLIYEKKYVKFWVLSLIAICFHYPVVLVVLLVSLFKSLLNKEGSFKFYCFIVMTSLVIYKAGVASFVLSMIGGKYSLYASFVQPVSVLKLLVLNFYILILLCFKKQFIKDERDVFVVNLLVIGVLIVNIFADFTPVSRLGYYLLIFQIIIVPKLIYSFPSSNLRQTSLKTLVIAITMFYYFSMFTNSLYVDSRQDIYPKLTPYNSWLLSE